jgi:hypothetical protein
MGLAGLFTVRVTGKLCVRVGLGGAEMAMS